MRALEAMVLVSRPVSFAGHHDDHPAQVKLTSRSGGLLLVCTSTMSSPALQADADRQDVRLGADPSLPDGGKSTGFGSLWEYQNHCDLPDHRKGREERCRKAVS